MAKYDHREHLKQVHEVRKETLVKKLIMRFKGSYEPMVTLILIVLQKKLELAKQLYITIQKYENESNRYESNKLKFLL